MVTVHHSRLRKSNARRERADRLWRWCNLENVSTGDISPRAEKESPMKRFKTRIRKSRKKIVGPSAESNLHRNPPVPTEKEVIDRVLTSLKNQDPRKIRQITENIPLD